MQNIEMFSALLGLLGAVLMASRSRFMAWAFVVWLVSNAGWLLFGAGHSHWFFFAQQVGFTITSLLGVWTWIIRPRLQKPSDSEKDIYHAIDDCLDDDFVALVQTPQVLHTTAPVTYRCLRAIYLQGQTAGRAMERNGTGGLA